MKKYLVESALLTHGLKSIDNEILIENWPKNNKKIVWIECGEIVISGIEEFCRFRNHSSEFGRVNYYTLEKCLLEGDSGALTASGTMKVCEMMKIPLAVTCGMGGIIEREKTEKCADIVALTETNVSLVATSPKDMFDIQCTIEEIQSRGIPIYGDQTEECTGYIFVQNPVKLTEQWSGQKICKNTLFLKKIPEEERISERKILEDAIDFGYREQKKRKMFHPAVNERIDDRSMGKSSLIQLYSLIANMKFADGLDINK